MAKQHSLFENRTKSPPSHAPLAERMRPGRLEDILGRDEIVGPQSFIGRILRGATVRSCILWGPPGSGKTTIARLLAERSECELETLSAVLSGIKDVRECVERARHRRELEGRGTILFVDEIHRFNKAQQDAFLPHVEAGTICLIGATTENPSFEIIGPLLSRSKVVVLEPLCREDLATLIDRALADATRGLGGLGLDIDEQARAFIAEAAAGDARAALGAVEAAADIAVERSLTTIDLATAECGMQRKALAYDKGGEEHYNVISAFIKSMRGGDADAAIYWLARMLEAGEDPLFIARRMVVFASEDVGLADPRALGVAVAVKDAVHFVGMPEARINLAHGVAYLAMAPKSRASYQALAEASTEVRRSANLPVPLHLRNAPTEMMKELGYGRKDDAADQRYLPDALAGHQFFAPRPPSDDDAAD